ncbi:MAG: peptidyl-prolyl cis-trans isomerase C [Gallionellaceae bacterium]|nr:MAG: peptidyl-prolyl cis-trans isomerase C [Gallionellaceae bacterium]
MSGTFRFAALALLGAMAASPAYADNKAAAVVNGVAIPKERLELRVKSAAAQGQQDTPDLRKAVRDDLITIELLSQEAVRKGLDKQPEAVQMLELTRQQVLVGAFMQDYVKAHPLGEDALTKAYDSLKNNVGNKEYNVRHILVEKEADAKSLAAKLKKGGKFDKLAEANSKDAGSKERGGELGWVPVGNIPTTYVKPFADALMNLTKGQISEPVQSQFGWHIIKLEDVRDLKMPTYEELKPQLMQRLQQQAVQNAIAELRAKAKVE